MRLRGLIALLFFCGFPVLASANPGKTPAPASSCTGLTIRARTSASVTRQAVSTILDAADGTVVLSVIGRPAHAFNRWILATEIGGSSYTSEDHGLASDVTHVDEERIDVRGGETRVTIIAGACTLSLALLSAQVPGKPHGVAILRTDVPLQLMSLGSVSIGPRMTLMDTIGWSDGTNLRLSGHLDLGGGHVSRNVVMLSDNPGKPIDLISPASFALTPLTNSGWSMPDLVVTSLPHANDDGTCSGAAKLGLPSDMGFGNSEDAPIFKPDCGGMPTRFTADMKSKGSIVWGPRNQKINVCTSIGSFVADLAATSGLRVVGGKGSFKKNATDLCPQAISDSDFDISDVGISSGTSGHFPAANIVIGVGKVSGDGLAVCSMKAEFVDGGLSATFAGRVRADILSGRPPASFKTPCADQGVSRSLDDLANGGLDVGISGAKMFLAEDHFADFKSSAVWSKLDFSDATIDASSGSGVFGRSIIACDYKKFPKLADKIAQSAQSLCVGIHLSPHQKNMDSTDDLVFGVLHLCASATSLLLGQKSCVDATNANSLHVDSLALETLASTPPSLRVGVGSIRLTGLRFEALADPGTYTRFLDTSMVAPACSKVSVEGIGDVASFDLPSAANPALAAAAVANAGDFSPSDLSAAPSVAFGTDCTIYHLAGLLAIQPSPHATIVLSSLVFSNGVYHGVKGVHRVDYMSAAGVVTSGSVTLVLNTFQFRTLVPYDDLLKADEAGKLSKCQNGVEAQYGNYCVRVDVNKGLTVGVTAIQNAQTITQALTAGGSALFGALIGRH